MSKVITELRKLAWIEQLLPELGSMAPFAERIVRRGAVTAARLSMSEDKNKKDTKVKGGIK